MRSSLKDLLTEKSVLLAELMADYVNLAANAGARIIGGCCGTAPKHIVAMREAIDNYNTGQRGDRFSWVSWTP